MRRLNPRHTDWPENRDVHRLVRDEKLAYLETVTTSSQPWRQQHFCTAAHFACTSCRASGRDIISVPAVQESAASRADLQPSTGTKLGLYYSPTGNAGKVQMESGLLPVDARTCAFCNQQFNFEVKLLVDVKQIFLYLSEVYRS